VAVCFIIDIAYNEILGIKAFLKNSNKGSVTLFVNFLNKLWRRLQYIFLEKELIIHTNRGAEFRSNEFKNLLEKFPGVIQSMSDKAKPKQNSVAERMVQTFYLKKSLF